MTGNGEGASAAPVYRIGNYELDIPRVQLRDGDIPLPVQPLVFDVLRYLIERRDRVVTKQELFERFWPERVVTESTLTARIKAARSLLGDDGQLQRMIRTVHGRGYQFVGPVEAVKTRSIANEASASTVGQRVSVRFVPVRGGVKLAVTQAGNGPPLVKVANWLTHVEKDAASPIWGHWVRDLSHRHTYVRYDSRGCGLSDRDLAGMDLTDIDLWVEDLLTVVDTLGFETFSLLGLSQGGPVAVAFAACYPERVDRLILHGTYARGMSRREDATQLDQASLMVNLAKVGWAVEDSRFVEVFTKQMVPDAGREEVRWFNELQRTSCDGETAGKLESAMHNIEITDLAQRVRAKTLVTHGVDEVAVPFDEGRYLASCIDGAEFLPLPSNNHILLQREPAWRSFVDAVERFIGTQSA
ncbi:MAG: alpha/beta fold hydrolase [Pseudomonadota bacterium]